MADESAAESVTVNGAAIALISGGDDTGKRRRTDRCFSFMEIPMEPTVKSLKHMDSKKFKAEITRWAKAVVTYARQVSDRFGSSRQTQDSSGERFGSSRRDRDSGDKSGERFGSSRRDRDSSDKSWSPRFR